MTDDSGQTPVPPLDYAAGPARRPGPNDHLKTSPAAVAAAGAGTVAGTAAVVGLSAAAGGRSVAELAALMLALPTLVGVVLVAVGGVDLVRQRRGGK